MSADNTLIIFPYCGKYRVYDVNFSDVSSMEFWGSDDPEDKRKLIAHIVESEGPCYYRVHVNKTRGGAEGWARRYMRTNIVEYGVGFIDHPDKALDWKKYLAQQQQMPEDIVGLLKQFSHRCHKDKRFRHTVEGAAMFKKLNVYMTNPIYFEHAQEIGFELMDELNGENE